MKVFLRTPVSVGPAPVGSGTPQLVVCVGYDAFGLFYTLGDGKWGPHIEATWIGGPLAQERP